MIAPGATDSAARARLHRFARIGLVVGLVIGLLFLIWGFFPAPSIPSTRLVAWHLTGYGGPQFDPAAAEATGVVRVFVGAWPTEYRQGDDSWLKPPTIIYAPWSVTIGLVTTDSYANPPSGIHSWYDTGGWIDVQLLTPLGGRALFDGSTNPPEPRLYR